MPILYPRWGHQILELLKSQENCILLLNYTWERQLYNLILSYRYSMIKQFRTYLLDAEEWRHKVSKFDLFQIQIILRTIYKLANIFSNVWEFFSYIRIILSFFNVLGICITICISIIYRFFFWYVDLEKGSIFQNWFHTQ